MKNIIILSLTAAMAVAACAKADVFEKFNEQADKEYLEPIRPSYEGRNPAWNPFAKKFIYAPAFDFAKTDGAAQYEFVLEQENGSRWTFRADSPDKALSPVWDDVPPGNTNLSVIALKEDGSVIDTVGKRSFMRDYPFHGPYNKAPVSYRDAALKGALYVHFMPEIRHWLEATTPDMKYKHNTYVCKIIGATVSNECLVARLAPSLKEEATKMALNAAQFLLDMSQPEDAPLAFFPPTYYLDLISSGRPENAGRTMTMEALTPARAFLDLYDLTGDKAWYDRAMAIMGTYERIQREDGSFPIKMVYETGEPVNKGCALLHPLLNLIRRVESQYSDERFAGMKEKAEKWMKEVPMETFDFTGQFEDVNVLNVAPYQNLTNCTAAPYASYLLGKENVTAEEIANAKDLIRLSEDQFVHWDYPDNEYGFRKNWAPCVHEQYRYEMPVDNSACNVANAFLDLYQVTGDRLALEKARALIDSIVLMQDQNSGRIPTTWEWRTTPRDRSRTWWANCSYSSEITLLRMAEVVGQ